MTTEDMPTSAEVREAAASNLPGELDDNYERFDRWHAEEIRKAKAEGWQQGARAQYDADWALVIDGKDAEAPKNPHLAPKPDRAPTPDRRRQDRMALTEVIEHRHDSIVAYMEEGYSDKWIVDRFHHVTGFETTPSVWMNYGMRHGIKRPPMDERRDRDD